MGARPHALASPVRQTHAHAPLLLLGAVQLLSVGALNCALPFASVHAIHPRKTARHTINDAVGRYGGVVWTV